MLLSLSLCLRVSLSLLSQCLCVITSLFVSLSTLFSLSVCVLSSLSLSLLWLFLSSLSVCASLPLSFLSQFVYVCVRVMSLSLVLSFSFSFSLFASASLPLFLSLTHTHRLLVPQAYPSSLPCASKALTMLLEFRHDSTPAYVIVAHKSESLRGVYASVSVYVCVVKRRERERGDSDEYVE